MTWPGVEPGPPSWEKTCSYVMLVFTYKTRGVTTSKTKTLTITILKIKVNLIGTFMMSVTHIYMSLKIVTYCLTNKKNQCKHIFIVFLDSITAYFSRSRPNAITHFREISFRLNAIPRFIISAVVSLR